MPRPSVSDEAELLKRAQAGDRTATDLIITRYIPFAGGMAKRRWLPRPWGYPELFSAAAGVIPTAIRQCDPSRPFKPFVASFVKRALDSAVRHYRTRPSVKTQPIDRPIRCACETPAQAIEQRDRVETIYRRLGPRNAAIMRGIVFGGQAQKEALREAGLTSAAMRSPGGVLDQCRRAMGM